VILDADGTTTGVINDQFGNGVATVTGTGSGASVTWNTTRVGAYGPLPGIQAQTLGDVSQGGGGDGMEKPPDRSHGLLLARRAVL
jgi:hypothetical protein